MQKRLREYFAEKGLKNPKDGREILLDEPLQKARPCGTLAPELPQCCELPLACCNKSSLCVLHFVSSMLRVGCSIVLSVASCMLWRAQVFKRAKFTFFTMNKFITPLLRNPDNVPMVPAHYVPPGSCLCVGVGVWVCGCERACVRSCVCGCVCGCVCVNSPTCRVVLQHVAPFCNMCGGGR